MAQAGYTPISLYYSTTASAVPTAANLVPGELAININDGKLYYENSSGVVTLLASSSGASGDVVGPASATNNGVALFDGTTGKLIKNSSSFVQNATGVGIGTTSPAYRLEVNAGSTDATALFDSTSVNGSHIRIASSGTVKNYIGCAAGFVTAGSADDLGLRAVGKISFATNGAAADMTLDASGNLGIGNTPTYSRLDVVDVKAGANFSGLTVWNNTTNATGVSSTINLPVFNGASGGVIQEIGNSVDGYRLNIYQDQGSGVITFGTGGNNERMRITSTGNVGIGNSSPTYQLDVLTSGNNGIRLYAGTSSADQLYMGNTGGLPAFGTLTNQVVRFITNGTERARIDTSGNVGIGTSSPSYPLQVVKNANGAQRVLFSNNSSGSTAETVVAVSNGTAEGSIRVAGTSYGGYGAYAANNTLIYNDTSAVTIMADNATNGIIKFASGGNSERMRITSTGNVGIGTATPNDKLDVNGADAFIRIDRSNGEPGITMRYAGSTTNRGDILVTTGGAMYFTSGGSTERMRIDSSGNVLVGTTTVSYSGANRGNITVGGTSSSILAFQVNSTNSGYIYHDGTTGGMSVWNAVNSPMYFATNNTERMRIDSDGNALFAKAVRATITTDNDLSFDMNAASNFKCTPTAGGALTFTNITSGQTGNIILVNNSNYAITAAATTKVSSTCLATISATGTYWLSYYSDGTNVYVANTGALA